MDGFGECARLRDCVSALPLNEVQPMNFARLAISLLLPLLVAACGASTPTLPTSPSPSPAPAYPGPAATPATVVTAPPIKNAPTPAPSSPPPVAWLGQDLLWQPGDLPAGVQPDRLATQIPEYFELKYQARPDAAVWLSFGRDSRHADYGHVEAYYFLKDALLKRAYEQLTQVDENSHPGTPLPSIGEQATLFPGGGSLALFFRRCHTLVVIRFLNTTEQQALLSYASRLDQRVKAVDCDGLAQVPLLTPLPSMPAATPMPPISIARTITATVERLPDPSGAGVIRAFAFADVNHSWLALGATILATADGGQTWRRQYTTDSVVRRMRFASLRSGWIETEKGYLTTRDGGVTWHRAAAQPDDGRPLMPAPPTTPMNNGEPSYAFCTGQARGAGGFAAIDAQTAWAFCTSSPGDHYSFVRLYFTDDDGKQWQVVNEQPPYGAWGVADFVFVDRQHGWFTSNHIGLFATADGGRTWGTVAVPGSDYALADIQFLTPTQGFVGAHVYAQEQRDTILRTDDGGASWRPVYVAPPLAPWPDGPMQFFADGSGVAWGGGVLTTRDAGRT